jgi:hypothetical protein
MRIPQLALALVIAGIVLSGCHASVCAGSGCGSGSIDRTKAQNATKAVVVESGGINVKSVVCPASVALKKGAAFTCTATGADGTTAPVVLTQTDGKGNVHITPPQLLHTGAAAKVISSGLTSKLKLAVAVTCPDLVLAHKGTTLTCLATHAGQTRKVGVTVTDARGDIHYTLQ